MAEVINKKVLYDMCENMEELYDNFYYPLLVENQELKRELKNKPDTEITLTDSKGNIYTIIQSERIDIQEKLNKSIQSLLKENLELQQALDEIEKYMTNYIKVEDKNENVKIEFNELLKIIQKAKGDVKNESKS